MSVFVPLAEAFLSPSVLQFFALAFAVSWVVGLAVAVVLQAVLPESLDRASLLVAKFGPSIAAVVLAARLGDGELGALLRATVRVRAPFWAFAFSLLAPPALLVCALGLADRGGIPVDWAKVADVRPVAALGALALFTFFGGGLGEELGWRGFALPRAQRSLSPIVAALGIGIVWAAWHYPALLLESGDDALPLWLFTLFVLAASVLLTWLFNATGGNVLSAVLFHAAVNASESLVEGAFPEAASADVLGSLTLVYGLAALPAALALRSIRPVTRL